MLTYVRLISSPYIGEDNCVRTNIVQLKRAINLRKKMTPQEAKLWKLLRGGRFYSLHFKRQQPLGIYIVDFFCHEKRLVIELDGGQHNTLNSVQYDKERSEILKSKGYRVIRFWNSEIDNNLENVVQVITKNLSSPMFGEEIK